MAGKVFFSVTMSLDGFVAPGAVSVGYVFSPEGRGDARAKHWLAQWSELQSWLFPQRWFRENLKFGEGGEEGLDNDIARATSSPTPGGTRGSGRAAPPSTSSTTASRARCSRPERPRATATCASPVAPRRFRTTWTAA